MSNIAIYKISKLVISFKFSVQRSTFVTAIHITNTFLMCVSFSLCSKFARNSFPVTTDSSLQMFPKP